MRAIVYYNESSRFMPAEVGDRLRRVVELMIAADEPEEAADVVFRAMNHVDGSEVEMVPDGERSMSVGDVVLIGDVALACEPFGWRRCAVRNQEVA